VEGLVLRPRAGVTAAATSWPRAEALTTPRLVLEPLRPDHARELAPMLADPARAARDWLRGRGGRRFVAHVHPDHAASSAVARHLGLAATDERRDGEVRWVES
jgi:hypothetical protein